MVRDESYLVYNENSFLFTVRFELKHLTFRYIINNHNNLFPFLYLGYTKKIICRKQMKDLSIGPVT